jgi:membrane dipeptidase
VTGRLIDLHCDWLLQYATESTLFEPSDYSNIPGRLTRLSGYMTATSTAIVSCSRSAADWLRQTDPWSSLANLLARYESEFAGRLLIGSADFARWLAEPPDGLTWGMLGVSGLDHLVREPADAERLASLFERGVRVFQLVESAASRLAGSAETGDDRGLTDLGRTCLARIATLATNGDAQNRPILDLAHLNDRSMTEVIDAVDEAARSGRLLLIFSHGALAHSGFDEPRAINHQNLTRLRAVGGVVGLTPCAPYHQSPEEFRAAIEAVATIPFEGRLGYEGIAIGTDFLEVSETLPGLGDAESIRTWLSQTFGAETAASLAHANSRQLMARAVANAD